MLKTCYQWLFRFIGVRDLYQRVVEQDRFEDINSKICCDLRQLLTQANANSPYFQGKFDDFLAETAGYNDQEFLNAYSKLPALTKEDYASAGRTVMTRPWCDTRIATVPAIT